MEKIFDDRRTLIDYLAGQSNVPFYDKSMVISLTKNKKWLVRWVENKPNKNDKGE